MGYRHYFVITKKDKIDELRKKTMNDFKKEWKLLKDKNEYSDFDDYLYEKLSPLRHGDSCIHELGKLGYSKIDVEERLLEKSKKVDFVDIEIEHTCTDENCLVLCSKETIKEYIKVCYELTTMYYEDLLKRSEAEIKKKIETEIWKLKNCSGLIGDEYSSVAVEMQTILDNNVINFDKYYLLLIAY